jgi:hypothetical protein
MALGCGLTSVRGNRGENYENEPLVRQKHTKKKKEYAKGAGFGRRPASWLQNASMHRVS